MDPDEALHQIRMAIAHFRAITDGRATLCEAEVAASTALEHFEALDGWMSRGGFKPEDWSKFDKKETK